MDFKVISFYKYIELENPESFRNLLREFCLEKDIFGRILIGKEGINGAVSGSKEAIEAFKSKLIEDQKFSDLTFREQEVQSKTYHKLVVRVRNEIVALGVNANMKNKGNHITPEELKEMLDNEEDLVILDARNDYEYKVGKFKKAVTLPIESFKELPSKIKDIEHLKDKKIVMYCTGGVRCEKSSAFLKEQGFKDVNQLKGGIIDYLNKVGPAHYEGSCFVFDNRLGVDMGEPVTECEHCQKPCGTYINCHNLDCDKLFVNCDECKKTTKNCSEECKNASRQRPQPEKPKRYVGTITNYFVKSKIAEAKLVKPLIENTKISIEGNTTNLEQEIKELKFHENEGLVTFPVTERVRRNDKLVLVE
ncbi:MAG: rhodanese-related sulfurtransferase [Candidatus Nanoarchaeia archaeon]|nr:rhodanese-related sulfurtransferase [Candidatus Nanoarchaeia archaeon]